VIRTRLTALVLATAIAAGGSGSVAVGAAAASKPVAVEIASPTVKPGGNCRKRSAGCAHGKFTGNFFGD
jgi:hypothetical protein